MIVGNIKNFDEKNLLGAKFKAAFEWITNNAATIHDKGVKRVDIIPGEVFANVDTAMMKKAENQVVEAHKKFIDIHIPINKTERIGWKPACELTNAIEPYNEIKDMAKYDTAVTCYVDIKPGEFCVMFPSDGHAPIVGEGEIKKLCIKIKVDD